MSRASHACRDEEKSRVRLFQQFTVAVVFEDTHLLNGNLIQLDQSFRLRNALLNEHRIQILHIRKTYQFVD